MRSMSLKDEYSAGCKARLCGSSKKFNAVCGLDYDVRKTYFYIRHNGETLMREEVQEVHCCMHDLADRHKAGPLSLTVGTTLCTTSKIYVYEDD